MEENQNQNKNQNPDQFNFSGDEKKKKKIGPLKGTLLAILIVFLICVIGLLIRMVVVGDGDYFKPIKEIFGIEEEKEVKNESFTRVDKVDSGSSFESAERYALLSSEAEESDVKHYRATIDMKEFFDTVMNEAMNDNEDSNFNNDEDSFYDDNNIDSSFDENTDSNYYEDNNSNDNMNNLEDSIESYMSMLGDMSDKIDGEIYFDVYFEGNEIVQLVLGYDYGKLIENLYEYILENNKESMENEGIENIDDFAYYLMDQFETILDEDMIYETMIADDEEVEAKFNNIGINEKDIKDAIEFNSDVGLMEVYVYGTTKLRALVSMFLERQEYRDELKELEEAENINIDEDNIIESFIELANDSLVDSEYGVEFVEIN